MEQVRDTRLDNLCESIGDTREKLSELRQDEQSDLQAALKRMRERGLTSYRHAGVEMSRVPGEEKLRVRVTSRGDATAENGPDLEDGAGNDGGEGMVDQGELHGDEGSLEDGDGEGAGAEG